MRRLFFLIVLSLIASINVVVLAANNDASAEAPAAATSTNESTVKTSVRHSVLHINVGKLALPADVKKNQAAKEYLEILNGLYEDVYGMPNQKYTAFSPEDALDLLAEYEAAQMAAKNNCNAPESYDALALIDANTVPDTEDMSNIYLGAR